MSKRAPMRDVVRVIEMEGERGGRVLVCVLECGCFATRRARKPPTRMPCVACFVAEAQKVSVETESVDELMAKGDNIGALFKLLEEIGATPTLHGRPVTEGELRAHATESIIRRLASPKT